MTNLEPRSGDGTSEATSDQVPDVYGHPVETLELIKRKSAEFSSTSFDFCSASFSPLEDATKPSGRAVHHVRFGFVQVRESH
jgi:hypothetical protein